MFWHRREVMWAKAPRTNRFALMKNIKCCTLVTILSQFLFIQFYFYFFEFSPFIWFCILIWFVWLLAANMQFIALEMLWHLTQDCWIDHVRFLNLNVLCCSFASAVLWENFAAPKYLFLYYLQQKLAGDGRGNQGKMESVKSSAWMRDDCYQRENIEASHNEEWLVFTLQCFYVFYLRLIKWIQSFHDGNVQQLIKK